MMANDRRATERRRASQGSATERRKEQRRSQNRRSDRRLQLELWMEEVAGDDVYFRRSGNLSEGGVFFDQGIPHAIGTSITLKFALPEQKEMVVARGKVVSTSGSKGVGMGVKFISVEGDGQARIREFILRG